VPVADDVTVFTAEFFPVDDQSILILFGSTIIKTASFPLK
jgi:hypothetical protein